MIFFLIIFQSNLNSRNTYESCMQRSSCILHTFAHISRPYTPLSNVRITAINRFAEECLFAITLTPPLFSILSVGRCNGPTLIRRQNDSRHYCCDHRVVRANCWHPIACDRAMSFINILSLQFLQFF